MNRIIVCMVVAVAALIAAALAGPLAAGPTDGGAKAAGPAAAKVYGEWRIRVRPDQGAAYERLIEQKGLPLFRQAGGRMVGWWKTLVGDLYEHVTIWEYDGMGAYQRAIELLSGQERFAQFVAARDPLLAGERCRFLRLAPGAVPPKLPELAPFVVHEVHRVPLSKQAAYLEFMASRGLKMLQRHGFRPVGPWVVDVGHWSQITYLFLFQSLAERDRLRAEFAKSSDAELFGQKLRQYVDEVTTQILAPAPFAVPGPGQ